MQAAITGAFSSPTAVGGVVEKICALSAQSIGAADKLQKVPTLWGSVQDACMPGTWRMAPGA